MRLYPDVIDRKKEPFYITNNLRYFLLMNSAGGGSISMGSLKSKNLTVEMTLEFSRSSVSSPLRGTNLVSTCTLRAKQGDNKKKKEVSDRFRKAFFVVCFSFLRLSIGSFLHYGEKA